MELNQIKLFGKVIDLEVGDIFWSNDKEGTIKSINYSPKGKNLSKLPRGNDIWNRRSYVSCQKYLKQIQEADNLQWSRRGDKHNRFFNEWEVKYVYKQDHPQFEDVIIMEIRDRVFTVHERSVERETEKLLFLNPHHPILYGTKFDKSQLLKIDYHYGTAHGMCRPDDYHKLERLLFTTHLKELKEAAKNLEESLVNKCDEITMFEALMIKYGFEPKLKPKRRRTK